MTIREIEESDKDMLTPYDIAEVLGSNPQTLRESMKQNPAAWAPIAPIPSGSSWKISRRRFLGWVYGDYRRGEEA